MRSAIISSIRSKRLCALCVFTVSFAMYLKTLCPTVYTMDNAELSVAAYTLSLAHPTGYPLFCLLGKLFTLIIPFGEVVYRIGIMNAFFGALTAVFLFLLVLEITGRHSAAVIVSLTFALSRVFWDVCTSGEVYALNAMFVTLNLLLLAGWVRAARRGDPTRDTDRRLHWLAFFLGLGLTNHMTSAFVLPGALAAVILCDRSVFRRWKALAGMVLLFAAPLSLYLYLPLRARPDETQIWGNVYLTEGFLPYVTGKMFRKLMFHMTAHQVWQNLLRFLRSVLVEFPIHVAWLLPIGGVVLRRKNAPILAAVGLVAALDAIYVINYDIHDIDSYYLPGMLALAVLLGSGFSLMLDKLVERRTAGFAVVGIIGLALVAIAAGNYRFVDKSHNYIVEDFGQNLLKSMPADSLVIACGDSTFNALLYDRVVHKKRQDIILLERNVIRTWRPYCKRYNAEPYLLSVAERAPEVERVYKTGRYSREAVKEEYLLRDIIAESMRRRPVYLMCRGDNDLATHPILKRMESDYQLVIEGLAYRVLPKKAYVDKQQLALCNERLWSTYRLDHIYDHSIRGGEFDLEIPYRYSGLHVRLGDLETDAGMYSAAAGNYRKALKIDSGLTPARNGLALSLVGLGDLPGAMREWQTVLQLSPDNAAAAHNLQVAQRQLAMGSQD
ncbi:MAG: DUF2723 domain-containing protein [Armatimonadota bacterium]|nr:DUF2723 domain-containing protein [Armatimonadota bacterium]